jgi:hypothetical protein
LTKCSLCHEKCYQEKSTKIRTDGVHFLPPSFNSAENRQLLRTDNHWDCSSEQTPLGAHF